MTSEKKIDIILNTVITVGIVLGIYFLLKLFSGVLFPFLSAGAVAVAIGSAARRLSQRYKIKRKYASTGAVIIFYVLLTAFVFGLVMLLYKQIVSVTVLLPEYSEKAMTGINAFLKSIGISTSDKNGGILAKTVNDSIPSLLEKAAQWLINVLKTAAAKLPIIFLSVIVTVVASFYLSRDYEKITALCVYVLPEKASKKLYSYKKAVVENIGEMLKGYALITVITFSECFAGLLLLRVKNALLLSALTAVVDFLPVLGSGSVLVPLGVITAVGGSTARAVGIFSLYVGITVIRYFIEPKIVGKAVGIHPLLMLAAVFLGFKVFGGAGIILLPLALLTAKCVLDEYIRTKKAVQG